MRKFMFEGRGNGPMQNLDQKMKRNANILTSSVDNFVSCTTLRLPRREFLFRTIVQLVHVRLCR